MKKLITLIAALVCAASAFAQQAMPVPVDPAVRVGKLDNGLTYYIRHHGEPAGQANFYIAQKVGSILENEEQRGLAHFLEHMCFNGTQHFAGNGVIDYCESIGVQFGGDLNAYTSIDETVYNIDNVPVGKVPSAVDSCLWILHDWADGLLLTAEDIDKERGVIHEEWRTRSNAQMRMLEQILPAVYPGNLYGQRLPIGLMSVIDNFPYEALRDYYEKWYRPDQQGIVVVGDINVDEVEAKIKDIFGTIATPVDAAERFYVQVEDNDEPIVALATDKEQPYAISMILCKHEAYPVAAKGDISYLLYSYARNLASDMLNTRLQEFLQKPEPPFINAGASDGDFFIAKTKGAFDVDVVSSPEGLVEAVKTAYREVLRAARGGFTQGEFERAKAEFLTNLESQYNQREKKKSAEFCREYVRHFIDNEPIPGIENEFALVQQIKDILSVDIVNQVFASLIADNNLVLACMLPESGNYPTKDEFVQILKGVAAEEIEPYVDSVSDEPLLANEPEGGKIVGKSSAKFGYNRYKLSNGAVVYIKTTDFNADEIRINAFSNGGTSLYGEQDYATLKSLSELIQIGGLGSFSATDLQKVLSGRKVNWYQYVSNNKESFSGKTTPRDFETMLQLCYLGFTSLRKDEDAFASWKNRTYAALVNSEAQPISAFSDSLLGSVYANPGRMCPMKAAEVDKVDYDRALEIARERFANAADFTFVFTGAIDEQTALPLIAKYIGSLPSGGRRECYNADVTKFSTGKAENEFERAMEIPMVTSGFIGAGAAEYDLRNSTCFDIALQTLSIDLLKEIRENQGGTYGIGAYGSMSGLPREEALYQIVYQTDPNRYVYLNSLVRLIVAQFVMNGPSEENLSKVKELLLKQHAEKLRENSYFEDVLEDYLGTGADLIRDYDEIVAGISCEDVRDAFFKVWIQNNYREVVMKGVANQ